MSLTLKEERITISGTVSIGATVTYTDKNTLSPAIVVIMGTGKTDRDGNEKGFRTNLYKQFAEFFAALGFVCVRYDKRGTFQSTGDFNTAGLHDLTDDAISVIRYVKSLPYVDETKVLVCGHSEGAMIATLLSEKEDTAGLLLFGGAATSMKDALFYQNELAADEFQHKKGLLGMLLRSQTSKEKTNAKVEAMFQKCVNTEKDRVLFGGALINAKWIREHASYSSEDYIRRLKEYGKSILAVTGTADISTDYRKLSALRDIPSAEIFTPSNVNHILREIDDDNSIMTVKKQYKRLALKPMHKATEEKIKEWLKQFYATGNGRCRNEADN
ncbi:MAG: lysophospholipase [Roseburia sp.]|nr:lysophospholipase [Roseburia sp.]MCM1279145.1 lysophospholipase [Robinsoniella sp.]